MRTTRWLLAATRLFTVLGVLQPNIPGPAIQTSPWGQPAPTYDPGGSGGSESPIVPIPGPDGETLQGAYVWFEYGNWSEYSGHYYWQSEGVLCSAVWVASPSGGCFAAGTKVLTPSGFKPIEGLKAGDLVISSHQNSRDESLAAKIRGITKHPGELIEFIFNGRKINTTLNHPILTKSKGWVAAAALCVGDELIGYANSRSVLEIIGKVDGNAPTLVYNVEIDGESSYFVGDIDWGFTLCVADSCSIAKERLAIRSKLTPFRSLDIQQILSERFKVVQDNLLR